jgi:hypothetical protein
LPLSEIGNSEKALDLWFKINIYFFLTTVKPTVEIDSDTLKAKQHCEKTLNCKVNSLAPTVTTWIFDSRVLNTESTR